MAARANGPRNSLSDPSHPPDGVVEARVQAVLQTIALAVGVDPAAEQWPSSARPALVAAAQAIAHRPLSRDLERARVANVAAAVLQAGPPAAITPDGLCAAILAMLGPDRQAAPPIRQRASLPLINVGSTLPSSSLNPRPVVRAWAAGPPTSMTQALPARRSLAPLMESTLSNAPRDGRLPSGDWVFPSVLTRLILIVLSPMTHMCTLHDLRNALSR